MCIQRHLTWPPVHACTHLLPYCAICTVGLRTSSWSGLFSYISPLLPFCKPGKPQEKSNLITPWFWTSSLQNCENINFCYVSLTVCAVLSWRHMQTTLDIWSYDILVVSEAAGCLRRTSIHPSCLVTENWIRDWYLASPAKDISCHLCKSVGLPGPRSTQWSGRIFSTHRIFPWKEGDIIFFLPSIPHPGMARTQLLLDDENMATSDGWQCGEPEGTRIPADGVQLPISISAFLKRKKSTPVLF